MPGGGACRPTTSKDLARALSGGGDDVLASQHSGRQRQEQRSELDRTGGARGLMSARQFLKRALPACVFLAVTVTIPGGPLLPRLARGTESLQTRRWSKRDTKSRSHMNGTSAKLGPSHRRLARGP